MTHDGDAHVVQAVENEGPYLEARPRRAGRGALGVGLSGVAHVLVIGAAFWLRAPDAADEALAETKARVVAHASDGVDVAGLTRRSARVEVFDAVVAWEGTDPAERAFAEERRVERSAAEADRRESRTAR